MLIKIDQRDREFSRLVKARAGHLCQARHIEFRSGSCSDILDCAHIESRRHRATRWHPLNALALCRSHHMYFGQHPLEFAEFVEGVIGPENVHRLMKLSNSVCKFTKSDLHIIHRHLKDAFIFTEGDRRDFICPMPVWEHEQKVLGERIEHAARLTA